MGIVADDMKRLRERAGLNQKELAKALDITPQFVNDIEKERRGPSPETARKLLKTLGASKPEARALIRAWIGAEWFALYDDAGGK